MNGTNETLRAYRAAVLEIEELEAQLARATPSGRPSGCGSVHFGDRGPSTNDPLAAAMQLADGLEGIIQRKREELALLTPQVISALNRITSGRMLQIVQGYYMQALTDEQIAVRIGLTSARVNQLRKSFLRDVG